MKLINKKDKIFIAGHTGMVGSAILKEFYKITNCPVLINTSFNVRGEPIVCTPEDAFRCFVFTQIDVLVIGSFIIKKSELPKNISKFFSKPLLIDD